MSGYFKSIVHLPRVWKSSRERFNPLLIICSVYVLNMYNVPLHALLESSYWKFNPFIWIQCQCYEHVQCTITYTSYWTFNPFIWMQLYEQQPQCVFVSYRVTLNAPTDTSSCCNCLLISVVLTELETGFLCVSRLNVRWKFVHVWVQTHSFSRDLDGAVAGSFRVSLVIDWAGEGVQGIWGICLGTFMIVGLL